MPLALDQTDWEILRILKEHARSQLREIGEKVHLTGQAVANRIQRLEHEGIIKGYTVVLDESKLEPGKAKTIAAYVTVFMKTADHRAFQRFLADNDAVEWADRISGDGCYLLKVALASQEELNGFLDQLLQFGNYRLNIGIAKLK